MIGRRAFTIGLGALLACRPALAQTKRMVPLQDIPNYRETMRDIICRISAAAKKSNPHFIVLARNAPELLVTEKREWDWQSLRDTEGAAMGKYAPPGTVLRDYGKCLDGMIFDGMFFGHDLYGTQTSQTAAKPMMAATKALLEDGRRVLTIEYVKEPKLRDMAIKQAATAKTLSYIDQDGDKRLGAIPKSRPPHENAEHVTSLGGVQNFLPMFHSEHFTSRDEWVDALMATNEDLLILDPFWRNSESLTKDDIKRLKFKNLGATRLVMASLPVGMAADTRFYWKPEWSLGNPSFLKQQDPDDPSQWFVEYWSPEWKAILTKYLQGILTLGFDGVMLDEVDAYLFFEDLTPLQ